MPLRVPARVSTTFAALSVPRRSGSGVKPWKSAPSPERQAGFGQVQVRTVYCVDGVQACGRVGGVRFTMAGLKTHQAGKDPG
jgi:hypothetical protein